MSLPDYSRGNFNIITIDGVHYTEAQVREIMEAAIAAAIKENKAKTVYRLKRDMVIPEGTEFGVTTPGSTRTFLSEHASLEVAISKDTTMSVTMDLGDALMTGLLEKRMVL
jgi:hypothetical protein